MRTLWFILLLVALSACGAAPSTPPQAMQATTPVAPPSPPQVMQATTPTETPDPRAAAILAAMASYEGIIRDGRTAQIATITDSAPIRRFLTSAAEVAPPSEGAAHRLYSIVTVQERFQGVVEAELVRDDGRRWHTLFRQRGSTWVLTEPTADELGERTTTTHGRLRIESFAGYPYTTKAADALVQAYARVERFFGTMPDQELRVVLKPAFGVGALIPFDVQAYYESGRRPQLTVTVPWSISFRPYDPALGWEGVVEQLAAHELTHYVHSTEPGLLSVNKVPAWVAEGLAEYVAAPLRLEQARAIAARDGWLPIDSRANPSLLNLEALTPQERATAYVQAQLLVAYLARDDIEQLWAFTEAYAGAPGGGTDRLEAALRQHLDTSLEQFLDDWQGWVDSQLKTSGST